MSVFALLHVVDNFSKTKYTRSREEASTTWSRWKDCKRVYRSFLFDMALASTAVGIVSVDACCFAIYLN